MAGLSQEELSSRMGGKVTKQAISKYEKGLMMPEASTTLIALSEALAVPVDYFFGRCRATLWSCTTANGPA